MSYKLIDERDSSVKWGKLSNLRFGDVFEDRDDEVYLFVGVNGNKNYLCFDLKERCFEELDGDNDCKLLNVDIVIK